ncbi:MAG TPA: polyphosphate kinase 2 family protein [Aestuariivirgaceae bacterium]|jgi:PPK2 family polyphosphate:nucleotide phosphotransferase
MTDKQNRPRVAITIKPGAKLRLRDIDPRPQPALDKETAKQRTKANAVAIDELQDRLFAENKRVLLVVLQGTDTSGKDGTIRSVFNTAGPLGVHVTSFRVPSAEELAHDFLWRVHKAVPAKGLIGIFNRSHYEDVLVVKVKKLAPTELIEERYEQINQFEKHLHANGTSIVKFMLHISKEEQKKRLLERLANPKKQWKFNPADLEDRKLWDAYHAAYEIMLERCSTPWAPWHVIPADDNWLRNWAISEIVRDKLEEMNPQYPRLTGQAAQVKID